MRQAILNKWPVNEGTSQQEKKISWSLRVESSPLKVDFTNLVLEYSNKVHFLFFFFPAPVPDPSCDVSFQRNYFLSGKKQRQKMLLKKEEKRPLRMNIERHQGELMHESFYCFQYFYKHLNVIWAAVTFQSVDQRSAWWWKGVCERNEFLCGAPFTSRRDKLQGSAHHSEPERIYIPQPKGHRKLPWMVK